MVSRRTYFVIAVIMFIIFFLFQFSTVALELWNDYDKNSYIRDADQLPGKSDAYQAATQDGKPAERMAVYIGEKEGAFGNMVQTWALYSKRTLKMYASVAEFQMYGSIENTENAPVEMVIIDPKSIDWEMETDVESLEKYVKEGANLVFCSLPDVHVVEKNKRLRKLLGIGKITAKTTTVAGAHLYEGFLLGGEMIYSTDDEEENRKKQDMDLTFPWYHLTSGTRVYMKGVPKDKSIKSTDFPPVIWEKSFGTGSVFAVNGTYMEDITGIGLLSAMEAKTKAYTIYPIVNAQNLVVAGYPAMAAENGEEMMRRYSQSMIQVLRDVIWPSIISTQYRNSLGFSFMMTPQFDYSDKNEPEQDLLVYYMKRLNEQDVETGLSGITISDTPIAQKLEEDQKIMEKSLADYSLLSFYKGKLSEKTVAEALQQDLLKDVRTIVSDYDGDSEILKYVSETVTEQATVVDGLKYTYRQDLRTKSLETALGYSSVLIDVMRAAYPKDKSYDTWKDIAKDMGWDLQYYWKNFEVFSGTTVSKCDERIRNFLAVDYKERRKVSTIYLDIVNNHGTAWFILRTKNQKVSDIEGGECQKIEDGAFLITTNKDTVAITLQPADGLSYIYR